MVSCIILHIYYLTIILGTKSCLHHDPKDNLLAQISGKKLVRLASPSQTEFLYPHEGMMNNTSQLDLDNEVDLAAYPRFKEAKIEELVLEAGQM